MLNSIFNTRLQPKSPCLRDLWKHRTFLPYGYVFRIRLSPKAVADKAFYTLLHSIFLNIIYFGPYLFTITIFSISSFLSENQIWIIYSFAFIFLCYLLFRCLFLYAFLCFHSFIHSFIHSFPVSYFNFIFSSFLCLYTDRSTAACSAKLVPTFADRGCRVVHATDPPGR
jgi:hypothetical protein